MFSHDLGPWPKVSIAWQAEEPLVQKELDKPEVKPYPWKTMLIATFFVVLIFPPMAFIGIPIVLWMLFSADVWRAPANAKQFLNKEFLSGEKEQVNWLLRLGESDIRGLNLLEAQTASRRVDSVRSVFESRAQELRDIPADGLLANKLADRASVYESGLDELKTLSNIVRETLADRKSVFTEKRSGVCDGEKYQALLKAKMDLGATRKAYELGVVTLFDIGAAESRVQELESELLCSSRGCTEPRLEGSQYCAEHTCGNEACVNPSGSAIVKAEDSILMLKTQDKLTKLGVDFVGHDEPSFNMMQVRMFCDGCIEKHRQRFW